MQVYETRVETPQQHPKLGRLEPKQLRVMSEEDAALYCDRTHQVPDRDEAGKRVPNPDFDALAAQRDPEYAETPFVMVKEKVAGIIAPWTPASADAVAKRNRIELEAIAPSLGVSNADDTDTFPNSESLAKAIFAALPPKPKKAPKKKA